MVHPQAPPRAHHNNDGGLQMSESPFKLAGIPARQRQPRAGLSEHHIRVQNVTRCTELADRALVAGNRADRRRGLLGRNGLSAGEGLWIIPCEAVHTFGMRFPIDLVYLDRRHRVLKTRSNVGPWRLSGCLRAHSVIELPAGTVRDTRTTKGDTLTLESDLPNSAESAS
jgi:uncharacterized protein